jgi:predicted MFS family arabinose efflux permease
MPTRQSFYLEMVGPEHLTNAMSLNTATFTGARITGPALAAILIATVGVGPVFLVNAFTFLAVIVVLLMMRTTELRHRERAERKPGQVREGIRYAWNNPALRLPLLVMAVVFLVSFNFSVLVPLLAVRTFHGGAGTFGQMLSLFGVGALVGSLVMASKASTANVRLLAQLAVAMGVATIGVAVAPVLWLEWPLMALLGATAIAFAITANSTLQLNSSEQMRGRVMSLYSVVFLGSTPIGGPVAGWAAEHFGPPVTLFVGGVVAVAAGLAGLAAARSLRRVVKPSGHAPAVASESPTGV